MSVDTDSIISGQESTRSGDALEGIIDPSNGGLLDDKAGGRLLAISQKVAKNKDTVLAGRICQVLQQTSRTKAGTFETFVNVGHKFFTQRLRGWLVTAMQEQNADLVLEIVKTYDILPPTEVTPEEKFYRLIHKIAKEWPTSDVKSAALALSKKWRKPPFFSAKSSTDDATVQDAIGKKRTSSAEPADDDVQNKKTKIDEHNDPKRSRSSVDTLLPAKRQKKSEEQAQELRRTPQISPPAVATSGAFFDQIASTAVEVKTRPISAAKPRVVPSAPKISRIETKPTPTLESIATPLVSISNPPSSAERSEHSPTPETGATSASGMTGMSDSPSRSEGTSSTELPVKAEAPSQPVDQSAAARGVRIRKRERQVDETQSGMGTSAIGDVSGTSTVVKPILRKAGEQKPVKKKVVWREKIADIREFSNDMPQEESEIQTIRRDLKSAKDFDREEWRRASAKETMEPTTPWTEPITFKFETPNRKETVEATQQTKRESHILGVSHFAKIPDNPGSIHVDELVDPNYTIKKGLLDTKSQLDSMRQPDTHPMLPLLSFMQPPMSISNDGITQPAVGLSSGTLPMFTATDLNSLLQMVNGLSNTGAGNINPNPFPLNPTPNPIPESLANLSGVPGFPAAALLAGVGNLAGSQHLSGFGAPVGNTGAPKTDKNSVESSRSGSRGSFGRGGHRGGRGFGNPKGGKRSRSRGKK
ncbi:hypothetical protein BKA69DRAFT_96014 [Paraphysoderma sedebokerense]|nr:hypothetical protein BKA69DRAFT_96014 [Paraphysoderma sedebokerense]